MININLQLSVPILPIFLFQNELKMKSVHNPSETTTGPKILEKIVEDSLVGPTLSNMSHPATMIEENGRVGALFASKAFVQLIVNPFVGKSTNTWGYEMPFMLGTGLLLVSATSE